MRLLLITNDYPPRPGGIQQFLGNVVDAYPHEVRVLAPRDGPVASTTRGEAVVRRGSRSFMWPTPGVARWALTEAADFEPDAVLFGAPYPLPWLIKSMRSQLDVPYGVIAHGAEVTLLSAIPGTRTLLRRMLQRADVVFIVSHFTARRVHALTGRLGVYVGGGVDIDTFTPASDRGISGRMTIGCVSRFVPRKGQLRLVAAVRTLRGRGHDVDLVLVGKGRMERRLRAAATGLPVTFEVGVPWQRLPELYAAFDVFAMPARSRWGGLEIEGLGLVYLEAAAAGLPVLAGTSGGAPETVIPDVTGYIAADEDSIVEALEHLIANPDRVRELGAAGRRRVGSEFTWDAVVGRIADGFRDGGGTASR